MVTVTPIQPAVVLVDDEQDILFSYEVMLQGAAIDNVLTCSDSRNLLPLLAEKEAGVVILDLQMPHISGTELLAEITANYPQVPVIIVTAANQLETAVACMKAGAFDYQVKPVEINRLVAGVRKALEMNSLRREISSLRESLLTGRVRNLDAFAAILTRNPKMQSVFSYLEAIAVTDQPVLITGETGVGKELVARAIHMISGVAGEFVAINSAGLDDLMFADTLFGHRKGAFTGAGETREGMVARAAGGTLFLDEIGDLSTTSQIKLLRLLQEREYHPLGADRPIASRARIVVATNQNLECLITGGAFRKDLYYRICAHQVEIPPLRDRREDIPLLLEVFLDEAAQALRKEKPSYRPELLSHLSVYRFPGNVRELKAMVFDAVTRHSGGNLTPAAFQKTIGAKLTSPSSDTAPSGVPVRDFAVTGRFPTLKEMDQYLIDEALNHAKGNQGAAAALLGLTRQALNKRLCRK
ncbi:MAG: sigma-54-dependent Fis family transcriptional regulator [Desulfuromonadales bacterium]|nr:sigma-54-dependent Fis family transcriptional regulator [Desulfuromonadales bacterium]